MSKESKIYLDNKLFTERVYKYNLANNPIKFYNTAFDYYVETYNETPTKSIDWDNVVDIKYEFELKRLNRSIKSYKENMKIKNPRNVDEMYKNRLNELNAYFDVVRAINPSLGKKKELVIPDDIGQNIYLMAERYYTNVKFYGYKYIQEDLIMDATEQCFKYIGNFTIYSSANAFSFFSTCIFNTFISIIKKYNKQITIKDKLYKIFYNSDMNERNDYLEDSIKGE